MTPLYKLFTLVILFLLSACATSFCSSATAVLAAWMKPQVDLSIGVQTVYQLAASFVFLICTIATWRVLSSWQAQPSRAAKWIEQRPIPQLVLLQLGLLLITMSFPVPKYYLDDPQTSFVLLNLVLKVGALIVLPVIWLWWTNLGPHVVKQRYVVMLWILISMIPWSSRQLVHLDIMAPHSARGDYFIILASSSLKQDDLIWTFTVGVKALDQSFDQWVTGTVLSIAFVACSLGLYGAFLQKQAYTGNSVKS